MIGQTKGAWLKHKAGQFKHYAIGGAAILGGIGLAHVASKSRYFHREEARVWSAGRGWHTQYPHYVDAR